MRYCLPCEAYTLLDRESLEGETRANARSLLDSAMMMRRHTRDELVGLLDWYSEACAQAAQVAGVRSGDLLVEWDDVSNSPCFVKPERLKIAESFDREEWRNEVTAGNTLLGFLEWRRSAIEQEMEATVPVGEREREPEKKLWVKHLRRVYESLTEFEAYVVTYGLLARLYPDSCLVTAEEVWDENPLICGSVDPADYGLFQPEKLFL